MKNLPYRDDTLYMTDYRSEWTLEGVVMAANDGLVPPWAKIYSHTDRDVSPLETQYIFDWSTE